VLGLLAYVLRSETGIMIKMKILTLTFVTILFCITSNIVWSADIENKWTIDVYNDMKMAVASVNGVILKPNF
jgi:hypothetical protein